MITYTISKANDDVSLATITKSGVEVEFTLGQLMQDVVYWTKKKTELTGTLGVNKATMENVKRTHPHIAEMSPEDLTAAYLYREAMGIVTICTDKLAEIEKALADYAVEKAEIIKQTGIVLPVTEKKDVETPKENS